MASLTSNGHELGQTQRDREGLACCSPQSCKESDTTSDLRTTNGRLESFFTFKSLWTKFSNQLPQMLNGLVFIKFSLEKCQRNTLWQYLQESNIVSRLLVRYWCRESEFSASAGWVHGMLSVCCLVLQAAPLPSIKQISGPGPVPSTGGFRDEIKHGPCSRKTSKMAPGTAPLRIPFWSVSSL